jgi:hypothetical protein
MIFFAFHFNDLLYSSSSCCFQVNQTGDLTVIDDLPAKQRLDLQQLCSLRRAVFSSGLPASGKLCNAHHQGLALHKGVPRVDPARDGLL